jgi:hypothetical protein
VRAACLFGPHLGLQHHPLDDQCRWCTHNSPISQSSDVLVGVTVCMAMHDSQTHRTYAESSDGLAGVACAVQEGSPEGGHICIQGSCGCSRGGLRPAAAGQRRHRQGGGRAQGSRAHGSQVSAVACWLGVMLACRCLGHMWGACNRACRGGVWSMVGTWLGVGGLL